MKSLLVAKMMIFCLILIAGFMLGPSDASAAPISCVELQCDCQDISTCEGPNGNQAACTFTITNCGALPIVTGVLQFTIADGNASPANALPGDSLSAAVNNNSDGGLPPGGSTTDILIVTLPPGDYAYSATVTATDEAGGVAIDSCSGTFSIAMCVPADIRPMSCPNPLNLMDKGLLPVALLGTPEFDVTTIDPATIQLEGVAPIRWSVEDVTAPYIGDADADCMSCTINGEDGFADLTLKFAAPEVIAALGDVSDGECLVVTLTGNLKAEFGGTPILAHDVLLIIDRGK